MPESREQASARAKRKGFKQSSVTTAKKGGSFIAPHGVESKAGKQAYADNRGKGKSKEEAAKIAHYVEKMAKK